MKCNDNNNKNYELDVWTLSDESVFHHLFVHSVPFRSAKET